MKRTPQEIYKATEPATRALTKVLYRGRDSLYRQTQWNRYRKGGIHLPQCATFTGHARATTCVPVASPFPS